jgi:glycosyltransferase involved in cell wall biosynthesis
MGFTKVRADPAPAISVVLPFRDAGATLDDALRSIEGQTLHRFECLLIDNGSVDSSTAVARDAASRDARFRLLQADGGLVGALNAGIAQARAPWIARMDADDLAHPARLERQLAALHADPSLAVIGCLVEAFSATGVGEGLRRYVTWLNGLCTPAAIRAALFIESPIAHPSAVIRRSALTAVGGYRDSAGPEDYDLWLRLLLRDYRAAKVPDVLLAWRDSPQRLSRTDARCHRRRFFETKVAHFPTALPPGTPLQICGAGATGRAWARALRARGYPVRRFIDVAARRIGRSVAGAPVDAPSALCHADGFVLAAAGTRGAREAIEEWLQARGLRPWDDYLAVA